MSLRGTAKVLAVGAFQKQGSYCSYYIMRTNVFNTNRHTDFQLIRLLSIWTTSAQKEKLLISANHPITMLIDTHVAVLLSDYASNLVAHWVLVIISNSY